MFPIAIPAFPFRVAIKLVNNSGKEVPNDTIVKPINFSSTPRYKAISVALSTTN